MFSRCCTNDSFIDSEPFELLDKLVVISCSDYYKLIRLKRQSWTESEQSREIR